MLVGVPHVARRVDDIDKLIGGVQRWWRPVPDNCGLHVVVVDQPRSLSDGVQIAEVFTCHVRWR